MRTAAPHRSLLQQDTRLGRPRLASRSMTYSMQSHQKIEMRLWVNTYATRLRRYIHARQGTALTNVLLSPVSLSHSTKIAERPLPHVLSWSRIESRWTRHGHLRNHPTLKACSWIQVFSYICSHQLLRLSSPSTCPRHTASRIWATTLQPTYHLKASVRSLAFRGYAV